MHFAMAGLTELEFFCKIVASRVIIIVDLKVLFLFELENLFVVCIVYVKFSLELHLFCCFVD